MDAATIEQVEKLALDMQSRFGGRVHSLRLLILDTGLTLLGQADTHHAKQLAQQAVIAKIGLPLLANQIKALVIT